MTTPIPQSPCGVCHQPVCGCADKPITFERGGVSYALYGMAQLGKLQGEWAHDRIPVSADLLAAGFVPAAEFESAKARIAELETLLKHDRDDLECGCAECMLISIRAARRSGGKRISELENEAGRMHYLGNLIRSRTQEEQSELTALMRKHPPRVTPVVVTDEPDFIRELKEAATVNALAFRDARDELDRAQRRIAELERLEDSLRRVYLCPDGTRTLDHLLADVDKNHKLWLAHQELTEQNAHLTEAAAFIETHEHLILDALFSVRKSHNLEEKLRATSGLAMVMRFRERARRKNSPAAEGGQAQPAAGDPLSDNCGECIACIGNKFDHMITCATCGNKRCPKSADHRNDCSGSNEAGQTGSSWGPPSNPPTAYPKPVSEPEVTVLAAALSSPGGEAGTWRRCRQLALNGERCILRDGHGDDECHQTCGQPCPLLGDYCPQCGVNGTEPPEEESVGCIVDRAASEYICDVIMLSPKDDPLWIAMRGALRRLDQEREEGQERLVAALRHGARCVPESSNAATALRSAADELERTGAAQ